MCGKCIKGFVRKDRVDFHPYTRKLLQIRGLKLAGYPFSANDLTLDEWYDLGRLEQCLQTPPPFK